MKLVVGLGNPGTEYTYTRHNVGFLALEAVRNATSALDWRTEKNFKGEITEIRIGTEKLLLLRPRTYMNLSGESVRAVMDFYKLAAEDILVLYDDVDIPTGTLRIRATGSTGTHNGMRSLAQHLGHTAFARVRIGIAPLESFRGSLADYVLGKLTEEELAAFRLREDDIYRIITLWSEGKIEEAMNTFNSRTQQ